MAPDALPSISSYRAKHDGNAVLRRLQQAALGNLKNSVEGWGFARYAFVSVLFVLATAVFCPRRAIAVLRSAPGPVLLNSLSWPV